MNNSNKIAVIGQFDWYGCMGVWVADAFEDNYFVVDRIDRNNINKNLDDYSFVMVVDCSEDFSANIPNTSTVKAFWSLDTHMPGGAERSVNIARKCDIVFSTNYEYGVKILEKFGIESYLMPITYSDRLVENWEHKMYEVVMIGHPNSDERIRLWNLLNNKYKCRFGKIDTANGYRHAMGNAKIIINQPTEPFDMILNNRFFEALASGGALLQKRLNTRLIENLGFKENSDFVYWDNIDDIPSIIDGIFRDDYRFLMTTNKLVVKYSMTSQARKIYDIILSKFWDRL